MAVAVHGLFRAGAGLKVTAFPSRGLSGRHGSLPPSRWRRSRYLPRIACVLQADDILRTLAAPVAARVAARRAAGEVPALGEGRTVLAHQRNWCVNGTPAPAEEISVPARHVSFRPGASAFEQVPSFSGFGRDKARSCPAPNTACRPARRRARRSLPCPTSASCDNRRCWPWCPSPNRRCGVASSRGVFRNR